MTNDDLTFFKNWFSNYTKSFYSGNEDDQRNIMLKVEHSCHVCENITEIGKELSLDENDMRLAEITALFHDIGRFTQYYKFRTFKDAVSSNHGLLGSKELMREGVLERIPKEEQELITTVVKFHSTIGLVTRYDERTTFFLKLVRDADKLDIWRVFMEFYESPEDERASATAHGVPDTPGYSEEIISYFKQRQLAPYSKIRNLNDFRLMQLSWVYDLHFQGTIKLLKERDYINRVAQKLPQTDEIEKTIEDLNKYLSLRLEDVHTG
jgi:hypothetical protein